MKLSELIHIQDVWESERRINNGHYNIPRIQDELDEAYEAKTPMEALNELIDVIIVTSGGIAKAANEAGFDTDLVDNLIQAKLVINRIKYPMETFESHSSADAITRCRHYWKIDPAEWETDGDIY